MSNKEMRRLARLAAKAGWTVETTGGGHLKWTPPNGRDPVFSSATPRNGNTANHRALLKKRGLHL